MVDTPFNGFSGIGIAVVFGIVVIGDFTRNVLLPLGGAGVGIVGKAAVILKIPHSHFLISPYVALYCLMLSYVGKESLKLLSFPHCCSADLPPAAVPLSSLLQVLF